MVFDLSTSVATVIFVGAAVSIAVVALRVTRLAMRVVTAVAAIRADHTGGQSKNTCDHDVASHKVEGIHSVSPRGQRT
jgi:hypothetical protein